SSSRNTADPQPTSRTELPLMGSASANVSCRRQWMSWRNTRLMARMSGLTPSPVETESNHVATRSKWGATSGGRSRAGVIGAAHGRLAPPLKWRSRLPCGGLSPARLERGYDFRGAVPVPVAPETGVLPTQLEGAALDGIRADRPESPADAAQEAEREHR